MNAGTSDASTSTDDIKARPLCLFYFTHPFGVLSPEPPTVLRDPFAAAAAAAAAAWPPAPAPPIFTGTLVDMRPTCPPPAAPAPVGRSAVLLRLASTDSVSTAIWEATSTDRVPDSTTGGGSVHRVPIHGRTLPPLRPPSPRDSSSLDPFDDVWSARRSNLDRFFLPPIRLPKFGLVERDRWSGSSQSGREAAGLARSGAGGGGCGGGVWGGAGGGTGGGGGRARRRRGGVRKGGRRLRLSRLLRRLLSTSSGTAAGVGRQPRAPPSPLSPPSPPSPSSPLERAAARRCSVAISDMPKRPEDQDEAAAAAGSGEAPPPAARRAPPALLRRRYSVPEIVMRKCRLNQGSATSDSVGVSGRCACAGVSPRELGRRDALLRRLRGRAAPPPPDAADGWGDSRGTRSLDGSRCELRPSACRMRPSTSSETRLSGRRQCDLSVDFYPCRSNRPSADGDGDDSQLLKCEFAEIIYDKTNKIRDDKDDRLFDKWNSKTHSSTRVFHSTTENRTERRGDRQKPTASASSCDILEIIVSESLSAGRNSETAAQTPSETSTAVARPSTYLVDLDEYVSDILVESLNSLTDRLENVTSSIDGNGNISIVEREIKVKLQNTGVNTVVHLSPMSNNQIIFGNEELYDCENHEGVLNELQNRDAEIKIKSKEISSAPDSTAALLRIRKLFNEDHQNGDKNDDIINVNSNDEVEDISTEIKNTRSEDVRPLSISLEVNASSDDEISPCASLVDSLDEPESPRTAARRPPRPASRRRGPLVRSAVAVLDLPPDPAPANPTVPERSESFFIPIKDEDCDSVNQHTVVADRMPEKIKQRLSRRHRRREMRQERVRRFRRNDREDVRRECSGIVDALIDNVVMKIAREEYRKMYVRKRGSEKKASKRHPIDARHLSEIDVDNQRSRTNCVQNIILRDEESHIRLTDRDPRRLYRKSEIREGSERIEILEILEYMTAATSRECSEITSDESANGARSRRSRIPVPVHEPARRPLARPGPDDVRSVFEVIPEELVARGCSPVGRRSPAETASGAHRGAGAPGAPRHVGCTSAATSPLRPGDRPGAARDAATMTSPARARLEDSSSQGIALRARRPPLTHRTRF